MAITFNVYLTIIMTFVLIYKMVKINIDIIVLFTVLCTCISSIQCFHVIETVKYVLPINSYNNFFSFLIQYVASDGTIFLFH